MILARGVFILALYANVKAFTYRGEPILFPKVTANRRGIQSLDAIAVLVVTVCW